MLCSISVRVDGGVGWAAWASKGVAASPAKAAAARSWNFMSVSSKSARRDPFARDWNPACRTPDLPERGQWNDISGLSSGIRRAQGTVRLEEEEADFPQRNEWRAACTPPATSLDRPQGMPSRY